MARSARRAGRPPELTQEKNTMQKRPFKQVDVFTAEPHLGNPVAVVLEATGIDDATMQRFTDWTNLSEATFVLPPTQPEADYRLRIFCPGRELPFAGHPTLGSCHAWLEAGGRPKRSDVIVQECGAVRVDDARVEVGAVPGRAPLCRVIDVHDAEADVVAVRPLEVVEQ